MLVFPNLNYPELRSLTERENQIFLLLLERKKAEEIQELLGISVHTVNAHMRSIYRKCNVHSRNYLYTKYRKLIKK